MASVSPSFSSFSSSPPSSLSNVTTMMTSIATAATMTPFAPAEVNATPEPEPGLGPGEVQQQHRPMHAPDPDRDDDHDQDHDRPQHHHHTLLLPQLQLHPPHLPPLPVLPLPHHRPQNGDQRCLQAIHPPHISNSTTHHNHYQGHHHQQQQQQQQQHYYQPQSQNYPYRYTHSDSHTHPPSPLLPEPDLTTTSARLHRLPALYTRQHHLPAMVNAGRQSQPWPQPGQASAMTSASPSANVTSDHNQFGFLVPIASSSASSSTSASTASASASESTSGSVTPSPLSRDPQPPVTNATTGDSSTPRPYGRLVTRIVVSPPNLEEWRTRLFYVNEPISMTNEEFETYFPHIDNVYSHRSSQKFKCKNFVAHYWDCRMKGRPPGTVKSNDPKKQRKRSTRKRNLCDFKIKITESLHDADLGQRCWTIRRVNGNVGDGNVVNGPSESHRHTLAESDNIKKNSVQRYVAQQRKIANRPIKITTVCKPTGTAAVTANKHAKEADIKFFAACFCPWSQRVWIALEAKGLQYQYCEIDVAQRPVTRQLLEANPRGTVPALQQGDWACADSNIILEYLEDLNSRVPLYPTDPRLKANCRMWIDHINAKIVPPFFTLFDAVDSNRQDDSFQKLQAGIKKLVQAADEDGPFFCGTALCLVDIHIAPFALRLSRILQPLRGWRYAITSTRWEQWLHAMENNVHIRATMSANGLYEQTVDLLNHVAKPLNYF